MTELDEFKKANKALWDEYAEIHVRSKFYDVESFKAGKTSLNGFEIEELGDVSGKSLLHMQCHFGMDTLSWARLGAKVTGVDFSEKAIRLARQLNHELDLDANFVCSDVYTIPDLISGQFDVVFTSHGVLPWLPDLQQWAEIISGFLKPGGVFYMADSHPFGMVFDDSPEITELKVGYPYFYGPDPLVLEVHGSYAEPEAQITQKINYEWVHTMGEILNSLISAGLRIEFLHEFPYIVWNMYPPLMKLGADGYWRLRDGEKLIPLMFSLRAKKPG